MSRSLIVVPWLVICTSMMSQAAPTVTTVDQQGQKVSVSSDAHLPNAPSSTTPSPAVLPPQTTQTSKSKPGQCPPQTVPCPKDTESQPADPSEEPLPVQKKPPTETGWINGAKNMCVVLYKSASDFLVGEKGVLTNLVYTSGTPSSEKKKSSDGNRNGGKVRACCIFYKNAPPTKDDEEKNEQEEEPKHQTNREVRPISLSYVKVQQNFAPGIPTPTLVPGAPGSKTKTETNSTSCCCVGTNTFSFKNFIKCILKVTFNGCATQLNVAVVKIN